MRGPLKVPWWFFFSVAAWGAFLNLGLLSAWIYDPSNRFGGLAFVLWLAGCGLVAWSARPVPARTGVWIASLVLLAVGELGSLQVLKQAALAILLPSLCRRPSSFALMAFAASSWTPAWGWVFNQALGTPLDFLRPLFVIACLGSARLSAK
ncbi:MAG: hypothetical protein WCG76_02930 [Verrucomicrobiota bacterium]